jgi:hypothetical protein
MKWIKWGAIIFVAYIGYTNYTSTGKFLGSNGPF